MNTSIGIQEMPAWCRMESIDPKYTANAPINVYETRLRLIGGRFKSSGFYEFDVYERGKRDTFKVSRLVSV